MCGPELLDVVGRGLGFLQAKDIRVLLRELIEEILAQHRPQPVDIP
jgi:hypothetical protein